MYFFERKQSIVLCNMLNNSLVECCVFFVDSFLRYYTSFHDMKILYTGFNIFAPRFSLFYSCKRFRPVLKPLRHIYKQIIFLIKTVNMCMKELRLPNRAKGAKKKLDDRIFPGIRNSVLSLGRSFVLIIFMEIVILDMC